MAEAEKNIKDTRRKVHTVAVMDTSLFLDLVLLQLFMLELCSHSMADGPTAQVAHRLFALHILCTASMGYRRRLQVDGFC